MDSVPPPPDAPYAGLTTIWSPALDRIAKQVARERTICWLMVSFTAIAIAPVGWTISPFTTVISTIGSTSGVLYPGSSTPSPAFSPFSMWFPIVAQLAGYAIGAVIVAGIIFWALRIYTQQLAITKHDLIYGNAALTLIDEQYGLAIETARTKRSNSRII